MIVCILILCGLGAIALPENRNNQMKAVESIEFISFSKQYIQEKGQYISTTDFFGKLDVITVEQWPLLGDPNLMISGYTA